MCRRCDFFETLYEVVSQIEDVDLTTNYDDDDINLFIDVLDILGLAGIPELDSYE